MEAGRPDLIDMDGHVVEPGDLYLRYVEPRFRENAIRVRKGSDGFNHFLVRGRPHGLFPVMPPAEPGMWARLEEIPAAKRGEAWIRELQRDWTECVVPAALDPHARLACMDEQGIDASLLFPTLGLSWEEDVLDDPEYTYAHLRAFNTWMGEFCSVDARRLLGVAHISLLDPDAAVREIERMAPLGMRAILVRPVAVNNRPPSHSDFDRIWAAVQDHDLLLALHIFAPPRTVVNWGRLSRQSIFRKTLEVIPNMLGLSDLMFGGVFSRFPDLRVGCIEINSAWAPYLLGGMDEKARSPQTSEYDAGLLPSEIFARNCWITPDPSERFPFIARHVPMDCLLFSTDYPHGESAPDVIPRWRRTIAPFGEEASRAFLRENALSCLGDPKGERTGIARRVT